MIYIKPRTKWSHTYHRIHFTSGKA